jgi:hypothetical protein
MQRLRIEYNSTVDAIVAIAKRLSNYESQHRMSSEDFFDKFTKGELDDRIDFVEWANDYQHFLSIKLDLENTLRHAQ